MPSLSARELAACVWAFSAMSYAPDVDWLEAFAQRCMEVDTRGCLRLGPSWAFACCLAGWLPACLAGCLAAGRSLDQPGRLVPARSQDLAG